jgi:tryptophan-rich sensory protein
MWQSFLWILTVVVLVGIFGSFFTFPGVVTWYPEICKPAGNPPDWLFSVAWPLMYLMLILSTYFAYESVFTSYSQSIMICLFLLISLLIALWPYFFFYRRHLKVACAIIFSLFFLVALQIYVIYCQLNNPIASALLVPLLLWLAYASYLNLAIIRLNPELC